MMLQYSCELARIALLKLHELKLKRELLGYHLERMASLMKVRISALEEIESADDDHVFQVYELMNLKHYCKMLDIDFKKLELSLTDKQQSLQAAVDACPRTNYNFSIKYFFLMLLCILMAIIIFPIDQNKKSSVLPDIDYIFNTPNSLHTRELYERS